MFEVLDSIRLGEQIVKMEVYAPLIAKKAMPGQFVIVRIDEFGEPVPLTINDYDAQKGSITIIFQEVGESTKRLGKLKKGEFILNFTGPLGKATELKDIKKAAVVVGGLGTAIGFPVAKKLYLLGKQVDIIAGFRTKSIVILEQEMKSFCNDLSICTDDGSYGHNGLVTACLKEKIENGADYDTIFAIGPIPMMKFVSLLTKEYGIKTIVSMNPIMVDGTGMCGCCRVKVGGEIKFACVDGPEFDGHEVDFNELIKRNAIYKENETEHICNLTGEIRK